MRELKQAHHNVICRENAKKLYQTTKGRAMSLLKYYNNLYGFTKEFYTDCQTPEERLIKAKKHHYEQKLSQLTVKNE